VLLTTDCVGSEWRFSVVLARALAPRGWKPALATIGPGPDAGQRSEAEGRALIATGAPLDWAEDGAEGLADGRAALHGTGARRPWC
jgi:hypothetical protein